MDTWMSPEALRGGGENSRRREAGQFLSAVPSYGCVRAVVCVCVCTVHMCISAGGVEQGVIPDGHTHTQMTASTHLHHVTTIQQFSPDCMLRCIQYSHFKAATYEQKTPWPRKSDNSLSNSAN